jgi:hypothetical protein
MAFCGISVSDLKHTGWNLSVVAAVTTASVLTAWGVKKLTEIAFKHLKPTVTDKTLDRMGERAGNLAGTLAAIAANYFIPSRFALINDSSLSKVFTLGSVLGITGFALDHFANHFAYDSHGAIFTVLGAGTAIAGHWSSYALIVLGALATPMGTLKPKTTQRPLI